MRQVVLCIKPLDSIGTSNHNQFLDALIVGLSLLNSRMRDQAAKMTITKQIIITLETRSDEADDITGMDNFLLSEVAQEMVDVNAFQIHDIGYSVKEIQVK